MSKKNHLIKSFRVSEKTWNNYIEAAEKVGLKAPQLSRLLFNRSLIQLISFAQKEGWENLTFTLREIN